MGLITNTYNKKCKSTYGGVKRVYLFDYVKHSRSEIKTLDMRLITFPDTFIYRYECVGTFTQTSEIEEGNVYETQSINIKLSEIYDTLNLNKILRGEFRLIAETNNGYFLLFGLRNGLTVKGNSTSGQNYNEFSGFTLDFSGQEEEIAPYMYDLENLGFTSAESFNNYILQNGDNYILNG